MASLKEIKGRINSVKTTLKITSAMKMVASAKLRKAQSAIESMLPYQRALQDMLGALEAQLAELQPSAECDNVLSGKVAVVAISSNQSLCGGFNANVIREALAEIKKYQEVEVWPIGRKVADSLKKAGYECPQDLSDLIGSPSYDKASAFAQSLIDCFNEGSISKVVLVYNHFVSTASQKVVCETYLPFDASSFGASRQENGHYILEPSAPVLMSELLPKVMRLKVFTVLLDSAAAEHAARTIAMQTATDNGEDILQELSLEYNKGRQQKITSEILDLVGGMQE